MAISFATPDESGKWFTYGNDPETGVRIRLKVQSIPSAAAEKIINEELLVNRKKRSLVNMSAMESSARAKAISLRKAHLALVDSENFELRFVGKMRAEMEATLPAGLTMVTDGSVRLDGRWTPEVKDMLFDLMPKVVDFVIEKSSEMSDAKEADEEESVTAFR